MRSIRAQKTARNRICRICQPAETHHEIHLQIPPIIQRKILNTSHKTYPKEGRTSMGSHLWVPFEGQRSNNGEHDDVHIFLVLSFSLIRFLLFPLPFPLLSPMNLGATGWGGEGVFFFCSWEKEDVREMERERGGTREGRQLRGGFLLGVLFMAL